MLCIPAHVTLEVESSPGLFALGVFPKVIHFSPRNLLALSTVAQNWIICLPHSLKLALFGYVLFFSRNALEKAVVGLKGIQLGQKHKCRIPFFFVLSSGGGGRTCLCLGHYGSASLLICLTRKKQIL